MEIPAMNQYAQDALIEVHEVLLGLRQFLTAVGNATPAATQEKLQNIEQQLSQVTREIANYRLESVTADALVQRNEDNDRDVHLLRPHPTLCALN